MCVEIDLGHEEGDSILETALEEQTPKIATLDPTSFSPFPKNASSFSVFDTEIQEKSPVKEEKKEIKKEEKKRKKKRKKRRK